MPKFLATMQVEQQVWQEKNFGKQPPHRPLLGVFEELGEFMTAQDSGPEDELVDAIGDVMVYLAAYCNSRGWSLMEIYKCRPIVSPKDSDLMKIVGKLAHSQLKTEQQIRGSEDKHAEVSKELLGRILAFLDVKSESLGHQLLEITRRVWARVSQRNWKKDSVMGGDK